MPCIGQPATSSAGQASNDMVDNSELGILLPQIVGISVSVFVTSWFLRSFGLRDNVVTQVTLLDEGLNLVLQVPVGLCGMAMLFVVSTPLVHITINWWGPPSKARELATSILSITCSNSSRGTFKGVYLVI